SGEGDVESHALPARGVLPVIRGPDPGDRAVGAQAGALQELLVDGPPGLRPGEDDPALGEGPDLVVDRGELQERKLPEDRLVPASCKVAQGLAEGGVLIEEVGLAGEVERNPERSEDVGPSALAEVLLLDVGDKEPGEDAHRRAEDGDL